MSNWSILQALAFEPRKAFAELAARPRFWFPLLVLVFTTAAITAWYTSVVDMEWLVDRQIRASGFATMLSEQQIAERVHAAAQRQGIQSVFATLASAAAVVIFMLLGSVYYVLAGKITNVDRSFRQWLSLTSWSGMPTVLGLIPAAFVLLTASSAQIPQEDLQALSFNALFFHFPPTRPGFSLLSALNLLQLASLYLSVVGVKTWSGRSWLFSTVFATLPYVLIFGTWAFISLR
jgi:hypothetical protein